MASSSSAAAAISSPPRKYDVFLSFRGEDTRKTFTSHLHAALLRKKLQTYIDSKLESGDEIGPALLEAIEKSRLSVIIFSKTYASSTWCLDEVVHILGCKERDGQVVIPIFYDISPSDVRKQQGSYEVAFAKHEERFKDCRDKVLNWRDALEKAANLSGFDNSNNAGTEADLVEKVVRDILNKLDCKSSNDLKGLVEIETKRNCLEMHDLLQEMGQTIVREQWTDEPGKRTRLWAADDVYQVLENDTGTSKVQCISFDTSNITRLELCGSPFKKMSNLRLLMIRGRRLRAKYDYGLEVLTKFLNCFSYSLLDEVDNNILDLSQGLQSLPNSLRYLYWQEYPLKSLPSDFSPQNLVELRLPYSFAGAELWSKNQNLGNLKVIELSFCTHLTEVPDLSRCPKIEHIALYGCKRLVRIPSYFKDLDKLRWLNLAKCTSLKFLPELPVLCCLEASGCTSLKTVSSSRNSLTQAWDKYELFRGCFNFADCLNLDENARTTIMADTQLRIMRVATGPLKTLQHEEEEIVMGITSFIPAWVGPLDSTAWPLVSTVCAGNEIPNWFRHQKEGSSITIKLPRYWYCTDFLGFALSVVLDGIVNYKDLTLECSCNFKTNSGESHKTIYPSYYPFSEEGEVFPCSEFDYIYVWYSAFALGGKANLNRSTFYKLVNEACFEFNAGGVNYLSRLKVKKCGISLLYAQDVETIKSGGTTGWSSPKKKLEMKN